MITLQKRVVYAGNAATTSVKSISIAFDFPIYEYVLSDADGRTVARHATGGVQTAVISHALASDSYQVVPGDAFIVGEDGRWADLASLFAFNVLQSEDVSDLAVTAKARYLLEDGRELGNQSIELICLPRVDLKSTRLLTMERVAAATTRPAFIAVNRQAVNALRKQIAAASLSLPDGLVLAAIAACTTFDDDIPVVTEKSLDDVRAWLAGQVIKVTATDANKLLKFIITASDQLFNSALSIPEIRQLNVGGTLTVVPPQGRAVTVADFQALEISAECVFNNQSRSQVLKYRFNEGAKVTGASAHFSMTAAEPLYRNDLRNPVRIVVKGIDGAILWSRDFDPDDPTLGKLEIRVPLQERTTLDNAPPDVKLDKARKLRGRVLTFHHECVLKNALVLIQAKETTESSWGIVGAATTDDSGNFSLPYPYGTYVAAQAVVSLAPTEVASIAIIATSGKVTISDDFLYLLLRNPECQEPQKDEEGECSCQDKPNRLPDHADLINSDAYTQDIGAACVNLSKPNRTISEYNYQAIVRTSDPDVANYTLTRIEVGLDAVDVSLVESLKVAVVELKAAHQAALNATRLPPPPPPPARSPAPPPPPPNYGGGTGTAPPPPPPNYGGGTGTAPPPPPPPNYGGGTGTVPPPPPSSSGGTASGWDEYYYCQTAISQASVHVQALSAALTVPSAPSITATVLGEAQMRANSIDAVMQGCLRLLGNVSAATLRDATRQCIETVGQLLTNIGLALDSIGPAARYELVGGAATRVRRPIALDNPVEWLEIQEAGTGHAGMPQLAGTKQGYFKTRPGGSTSSATTKVTGEPATTFSQAVTIATGHVLHYKAQFKADGYSLGDLIYSLPLAPGQKKEIVVFDSTHTLVGAESQALTQNERLAMGLVDERDITSQLAGRISESMRGSSSANTSGFSAGFGTGGQGYGGTGAYGGSGSAVIGIAGGVAQASSNAAQDSSRDVAQFFGEKLRQSIMQNAEGYRQLNASVVTTVQEGQRYGVTSEVVANHNHCHALTMMYFEVLRHFAVFQELASVEECVFVPLLLTRFSTDGVAKWRDVLAPALLPLPSDTYLQPLALLPNIGRQHPLLKAFDAIERIRARYANIDYPDSSYDEDPIRIMKGTVRMLVNLPRPRTRFDRIMSFPIVKQVDAGAVADAAAKFAQDSATYAAKAAFTLGLYTCFEAPPVPPTDPTQFEVAKREAIADAFMRLDANYETVPPAQCMRIVDFTPKTIAVGGFGNINPNITREIDFFAENTGDKEQWTLYSQILGYPSVAAMLNAHFRGNLIAEWDQIFQQDIAPLILEKILDAIRLDQFSTDFSAPSKYHGGERLMTFGVVGRTSKARNQLPDELALSVSSATINALKNYVTLRVEDATLTYSTSHYNGVLFSGSVGDDLLDGTSLYIPEGADEKRNPRREDRYLAAKLVEHLNSHLEYYNKVLWSNLDPDRRYMLLDGFSIQVYDDQGVPAGLRSLASVVKNEVITVAGNSLVLPVAPGYRVSGAYITPTSDESEKTVGLLDHYQPLTPLDPFRISVPSRGVFAEAVQGACNACEKIETDRLQDWNRFPNTDEPPTIGTVTPPTPVVTDWRAAFKDFAAPIVNVQNAPAMPAPGAGLQGLSDLLGKSGVFKDITGLDANQQNAIRTYLSNQENAKAFAEMAKEMAMQSHNTQNSGKIMDSIASAKKSGDISKEDAGKLVKDHLQQQIDGGESKKAEIDQAKQLKPSPLTQAVIDAASQGRSVTAQKTDEGGAGEEITIDGGAADQVLAEAKDVPGIAQPNANSCWAAVATMMCMWRDPGQYQSIDDVMAAAGDKFVQLYNQGRGGGRRLPTADKAELLSALGMTSAPSGTNYPLQSYIDWMNTYGPLWVSIDSDSDLDHFSAHAIVVIRVTGTGTPDGRGTNVTYIDPMGAKVVTVSFADFVASFEGLAKVPAGVLPSIQVVRFADPAGDGGDGGGKPGGGLAGAGAAIGGEVLSLAADIAGTYVKTMMAAGGGTLELPSNVTLMLSGTQDADYKPNGIPMVDAIRRCRITFINVAGTGPGDGLDGVLTLEWFSTRYFGPISSRVGGAMRTFFRGILFAKSITGRGTLDIGGALESGDVQIKLFSMGVEDKVAPPYMTVMADITVNVKAKTASGDSIVSKVTLALHPDDPANFKIIYERAPHKALRVEVDTSP